MLLKEKTLISTLKVWSIRHKDKSYLPEELTLLALDYLEDLHDEGITEEAWPEIAKIVRKKSRFFPLMVDILQARDEYIVANNRRIESTPQLTEAPAVAPENIPYNEIRCFLLKQLGLGMEMKDCHKYLGMVDDAQESGEDHVALRNRIEYLISSGNITTHEKDVDRKSGVRFG